VEADSRATRRLWGGDPHTVIAEPPVELPATPPLPYVPPGRRRRGIQRPALLTAELQARLGDATRLEDAIAAARRTGRPTRSEQELRDRLAVAMATIPRARVNIAVTSEALGISRAAVYRLLERGRRLSETEHSPMSEGADSPTARPPLHLRAA
jgi:hypothetical protein